MLSSIWKKNLICVGIVALAGASAPSYALPAYSITDLGVPGGYYTAARGINNAGQVVGDSTISERGSEYYHAFLSSGGATTDLGTLGGRYSSASDINNAGQIVGESTW